MMNHLFRLLVKHGIVMMATPGGVEVCAANTEIRAIKLGYDILMDPTKAGIIGMHELGHIMTLPPDAAIQHLLRKSPEALYASELMAWDWAQKNTPEEFWPALEEVKASALSTYYF